MTISIELFISGLRYIFKFHSFRRRFILFSIILLTINILGSAIILIPIMGIPEIGFLSNPSEYDIYLIPLIWFKFKYNIYTDILIVFDIVTVIFIAAASLLAGFVLAEASILGRVSRYRCKVEKAAASVGALATFSGLVSGASSILSCQACGGTIISTLIYFITLILTGGSIGFSIFLIDVFKYILIIGIIINLILLFYLTLKIGRLLG